MGKFVVGILAVILLQIAFFGYTSTYWSAPTESVLAKGRRPVAEVIREMNRPNVVPPSSSVLEVTPALPAPRVERPTSIQRARIRTVPAKREQVRKENVRVVSTVRARTENPQLSAVAPRRYTVVVTDDLPKVSTATANSSDVAKPRKRSFLAKSFSVVVKKPWGWMKSLASKLD